VVYIRGEYHKAAVKSRLHDELLWVQDARARFVTQWGDALCELLVGDHTGRKRSRQDVDEHSNTTLSENLYVAAVM